MAKNQATLKGVPTYIDGAMPTADILPEQKALAPSAAARNMLRNPQVANPDANASVFQPTPARIIGDMVTGQPQGGYATQDTVVSQESDIVAGGEFAPSTGDSHRGVSDWSEEKGSGTTPLQPGAQGGS